MAFQRSLSAHVTGADGRVPFTSLEEKAVLDVLRKGDRWPCFESLRTRLGLMEFRGKGYHERSEDGTTKRVRISKNSDSDDQDHNHRQEELEQTRSHLHPTSYLNAADHMAVMEDTFFDTSQMLLTEIGTKTWNTILSLGRMLLISKGWVTPKVMDAANLLGLYESRFPGHGVLVLDITEKKSNQIMFMNNVAVRMFCNGVEEIWLSNSEQAVMVLQAMYTAVKNPGQEIFVEVTVPCQDGITTQSCYCFFTVHNEEKIVVVRAFPKNKAMTADLMLCSS